MADAKEIPSGGTRLKYNISYVKALSFICVALLIYVLFTDVPDAKFEQIKWILIFGFSGSGVAMGIYTASENGVKSSYAALNRGN